MKKRFFSVLLFLLIVTSTIFAQSAPGTDSAFELIAYRIDKCLSLLDKPVPKEFQLLEPDFYMNDEGLGVYTRNKLIHTSLAIITTPPDEEILNVAYVSALSLLMQRYNFIDLREAGNSVILT